MNSSTKGPTITKARLSTSVEPTGMAGTTSWNSARWSRPSSNYRSSRLASAHETGGGASGSNCSSAASSCASSIRDQSPLSHALPISTLRSSERASSAATRPATSSKEPTTIRPNSRYGASFMNSSTSNGSSTVGRSAQSASSALSPRQELQRTSYPYRSMGLGQPRATLVDMRQSLRPVKRQMVTDYKSVPRSSALSSVSSTTSAPLALFTSSAGQQQVRTSSTGAAHSHYHPQSALSPISPFPSKCISPPSISRSSSTVTSPITSPIAMTPRPIPKSERPWRQKLADAQRLREAQAERSFGQHHMPLDIYDSTTARLLAARTARRSSVDQQQQQTQKQQSSEQQLEKEIAALKCYVSEPGALDKNATVAKFRQKMADSQKSVGLASSPTAAALLSASSLLARMPSLSRRSTTAVTREALPQQEKEKDRPLSLIETPLGQRRLSVVKEAIVAETRPEEVSEKEGQLAKGKKESPRGQRRTAARGKEEGEGRPGRPSSRASTSSSASGDPKTAASPTEKMPKVKGEKKNGKSIGKKKEPEGKQQNVEKEGEGEEAKKVSRLAKKRNEEDEKGFNAIVQFKPQSMLRRKISNEEDEEGKSSEKKTTTTTTTTKRKEPLQKTTPKWRKPAVTLERKTSQEEWPKPVPGTWERTPKERFISQNKHLIRKASSASALHTHKMRALARVSSVRMLAASAGGAADNLSIKSLQNAVKAKGSPTAAVLKMIKSIARPKQQRICAVAVVDKQFANKRSFRLGVRKTLLLKSVPHKLCVKLRCRSAQIVATSMRFNIVWKEQKKTANVTILVADWEQVASALIREPSRRRATADRSPLKRIQQELDKENLAGGNGGGTGRPILIGGKGKQAAAQQQRQKQIPSSTRQQQPFPVGASLVAAAAGSITAAVAALSTGGSAATSQQQKPVPPSRSQHRQQPSLSKQTSVESQQSQQQQQQQQLLKVPQLGKVPLILPDHSVLEHFVQSKRDALDRLHEEAEGILDQAREISSSRSPAGLQLPTGASTAASVSLPGSKRNSQMLATAMPPTTDAQLPQSLSSSFHAAVQATAADLRAQQQQMLQQPMARLRRPEVARTTLSTQTLQAFDKPKSQFEEQMQRQAIQLHQKAVRQSLHEPSAIERQQAAAAIAAAGLARRRSAAGDNAEVAQTFVAQAARPYQTEQRYAAHIPLSGRQSTTSIESANSSSLDAATHQLDQMIDQARYKHSQQRNKFKEAIDYLDHIFEDFQREADMRQPPTKKPAPPPPPPHQEVVPQQQQQPIEPVQATFRAGNVKSAKEAFEKVAAAIASEKKTGGGAKLKKHGSAPSTGGGTQAKQQKPSAVHPLKPEPFPLLVVLHPPSAGPTTNGGGSGEKSPEEEEELVEVSETIVLPSKNTADRLDFTRNWLASGDVRTWAESSPGPRRGDQLLGHKPNEEEENYDSDHSLGSCSAEVAAINAANERRQRQKQQQQQMAKNGGGAPKMSSATAAKKNGTALLTHHQSLKNGQAPLRQKQPPSTSASVAGSVVPPPQIAAPAAPPAVQGTLSRPQPYRPQPQLGVLPPGLAASGQMQKVPSIDQLRLRASQERACSQDFQQRSMGSSVHSQEGFRPQGTYLFTHSLQRLGLGTGTGGAFHSYTPTTMLLVPGSVGQQQQQQQTGVQQQQLKGSIQSLPESALCTAPTPQQLSSTTHLAPASSSSSSTAAGLSASNNYPPVFLPTHPQQQQQSRQFATLARMDSNGSSSNNSHGHGHQNGHQQPRVHQRGGGGGQQPAPAIPAHQSAGGSRTAAIQQQALSEHALAIDALVAELELNTDAALSTAEKRRSFPTMQTEVAQAKAKQTEKPQEREEEEREEALEQQGRRQPPIVRLSARRGGNSARPLEEISENVNKASTSGHRKQQQSAGNNRPFETINQERLNPSRVDAMARVFGQQQARSRLGLAAAAATAPVSFTTNCAGEGDQQQQNGSWTRRAATTGRIPSSSSSSSSRPLNGMAPLANSGRRQPQQNGCVGGRCDSSAQGGGPALTGGAQQNGGGTHQQLRQAQPPPSYQQSSPRLVRGTRAGTKSAAAAPAPVLLVERHGRDTPNLATADEDFEGVEECNGQNNNGGGGFYDNIQRHRSRPSPGYYSGGGGGGDDCSSVSSQPGSFALLPPSAASAGKSVGGRIGQLIRKLGNVGSGGGKPPISVASMVSLNRVSNEPLMNGRSGGAGGGGGGDGNGILVKCSSLSGEPWRSQVLGQQDDGGKHSPADEEKAGGIGSRLKQSIFGGMVRRRVPI